MTASAVEAGIVTQDGLDEANEIIDGMDEANVVSILALLTEMGLDVPGPVEVNWDAKAALKQVCETDPVAVIAAAITMAMSPVYDLSSIF